MKSYRKLIFAVLALLALTVSLVTSNEPAWADAGGLQTDKIEPALLSALRANPHGTFNVLLVATAPNQKEVSKHSNDQRAQGAMKRAHDVRARNIHGLPLLGAASANVTFGGVAALSRDPFIGKIALDRPMKGLGAPGAPLQSLYTQIVRAPDVWAQGDTGQGIGVAVVDSGVLNVDDLNLPNARLVATVDLVDGLTTATDPGGHGTHVAGIIGGNGTDSAQSWEGVAPSANIINVRVINGSGNTNLSTVIRGIQWVVQNRRTYNIRIMNLSLGGTSSLSYRDDTLDSAVEMAWASGIFVVVAAGNTGPLATTIATPGNDPFVFTVGALDDNQTLTTDDDSIAVFSSHGPTLDFVHKPDAVAPGRRIVSLRSPGSFLDNLFLDRITDSFYIRMSGTSMATPVVAGTAALMLQRQPWLKPNQLKGILKQTAHPVLGADVDSAGAGLIDAYNAVNFWGWAYANWGLTPSDGFANSIRPLMQGIPLAGLWRSLTYQGRDWTNITWDNITWDRTTWENITWENITWDNITWTNITWDNITWDAGVWDTVPDVNTASAVQWDTIY